MPASGGEVEAHRMADGTLSKSVHMDDPDPDDDDDDEIDLADIDPDERQSGDKVRQVTTLGRGRRLHQGVVTGDPVSGYDHDSSVYAYLSGDGFEVTTHDDGHWPVDELHTALWVEPQHVPDLILALGGRSGDDPVELLAQQVRNGTVSQFGIGIWFSKHSVPYTTASKSVSNL